MAFPSKQTAQSLSRAGQKAAAILRKEKKEPVMSENVQTAVELMVFEGQTRSQAAESVGVSDEYLRKCFIKPDVLAYFNQCQEVLRTSARPRALRKIIDLSEKAGSERVALDASKYLDGMDRGAHQVGATVINNTQINNTLNVTPGYVIDLRPDDADELLQIRHLEQHGDNALPYQRDVPEDE